MGRSDLAVFVDVFTLSVLVFLAIVAWTVYDLGKRNIRR